MYYTHSISLATLKIFSNKEYLYKMDAKKHELAQMSGESW